MYCEVLQVIFYLLTMCHFFVIFCHFVIFCASLYCSSANKGLNSLITWSVVLVLGMLRIGERRLVMLTMMQMEGKLAKADDPALNDQVCLSAYRLPLI